MVLDVDGGQAPHLAGPQAGAAQPVGAVRRRAPDRLGGRGRNPQHHRVRPVHRPVRDIDGMVHMSDLSWDEPGELAMAKYEKGHVVQAKVLDVDVEKERISLGIKQLQDDPAAAVLDRVHKGDVVTCIVTAIQANGIEVKVDDVLTGFIRRAELARDKADQRPDRFAVGEKVDAKITAIDRAARKLA